MGFLQYKVTMPQYDDGLIARENRRQRYVLIGKEIYPNLLQLNKETYNKIKESFYNGSELALEILIEYSIFEVVQSVAKIYSKFDLEDVLSYEEAISVVLEDIIKTIRKFEALPKYFTEFSESYVNKLAFSTIITKYREYGVRTNVNVPMSPKDIEYLTNKKDHEEFPLQQYNEKNIIGDILNAGYLNKREKEILSLKYGIFDDKILTFQEIANKYNLSIARIQQITYGAIEKIKNRVKIENYVFKL